MVSWKILAATTPAQVAIGRMDRRKVMAGCFTSAQLIVLLGFWDFGILGQSEDGERRGLSREERAKEREGRRGESMKISRLPI